MKVINVDGKLQTTGSWAETEDLAATQARATARLRAELRAMLSGNVQFHVDPNAAPAISGTPPRPQGGGRSYDPFRPPTTDPLEWKKTRPPAPGVYVASIYRNESKARYWDGAQWHFDVDEKDWGDRSLDIFTKMGVEFANYQDDIEWLYAISTDVPAATPKSDLTWKDMAPPKPGVYIASSLRSRISVRYWDGKGWSKAWKRTGNKCLAKEKSKTLAGTGTNGVEWLELISDDLADYLSKLD